MLKRFYPDDYVDSAYEIPYEEQEDGSIKTILPPADAIDRKSVV